MFIRINYFCPDFICGSSKYTYETDVVYGDDYLNPGIMWNFTAEKSNYYPMVFTTTDGTFLSVKEIDKENWEWTFIDTYGIRHIRYTTPFIGNFCFKYPPKW